MIYPYNMIILVLINTWVHTKTRIVLNKIILIVGK